MMIWILVLIVALSLSMGSGTIAMAMASDFNTIVKSDRPTTNPDFNPDYSCLFDIYQMKCRPGAGQECPEPQFASNEDFMCFPLTLVNGEWVWKCPKDYHSVDDDESGQCYPNEDGCEYELYILVNGDRCAYIKEICSEDEYKTLEVCLQYKKLEKLID